MRRLTIAAIAAVSTIALTQVASAADLPRKAPYYMPPLPPIYSWTGFYVGLNAGAGWNNNGGIDNGVLSTSCFSPPINAGGCPPTWECSCGCCSAEF